MNLQRFHASASIALLRTLLFCVNLIFMITGGILILLGIALRYQLKELLEITPEINSASPYFLVGLGLFIFGIGLFAFWCTIKGHITLLYMYSLIILLIFIVEILLAVTVLMRKRTYEQTFKTVVQKLMRQYPSRRVNFHIDRLQKKLFCCGIHSYTDWFQTPYGQVPASCCKKALNHTCVRPDMEQEHHLMDIYQNGCYEAVILAIENNYPLLGGMILFIALFPLIGIVVACCLAHQMSKHRYERV